MRLILIGLLLLQMSALAQLPSGFQAQSVGHWDFPMGVTFDSNNDMYVWERDGRFFKYSNGSKTLLIDLREEIVTYGDFGLLSAVLDPNFATNGYVYLYYVVDRHHLLYHGTLQYSSSASLQGATIARLTRYTLNIANGFNSVVPGSRFILVGETKSTGFPLTGIYHAGGQMKFSIDGTLLVGCGDGAVGADYESEALADGIITQTEYNANRQWRCQMQNSLNGKIVRIDPATGNGVPSNPYFESANPRSPQSRVWVSGLRNPFRMAFKPGTGSHSQNAGSPGTLLLGDVGQEAKEEIDAVTEGGQNFGWPRFEGFSTIYLTKPPFHPAQHVGPIIEYGRTGSTAKVKSGNTSVNVGSAQFPYSNFTGGCAIGGVFYEGTTYPEEYHGAYFMAEFNDQWVKCFKMDANNNLTSQINFSPQIIGLISFAYNRHDQSIYYTTILGEVKRLVYAPGGNRPPVAAFDMKPEYGTSPLTVVFDASKSNDPDNQNLTYHWNFGNGSTATGVNTVHTFSASSIQTFDVTLTVTDSHGGTNSITKKVSLNNTPPKVLSTNLDNLINFNPIGNATLPLNAAISDSEEADSSLTAKWEAYLFHNDHRHLEYSSSSLNTSFILGEVPCDNVLYYYRFYLYVTDSHELTTTYIKDLYPNCNAGDTTSPSELFLKVENFTENSFKAVWNNVTDNTAVKNYEIRINGANKGFVPASLNHYTFQENGMIQDNAYEIQVIARDHSGNPSVSSKIHFTAGSFCSSTGTTDVFLSSINETSSVNGLGPIEKNRSNGGSGARDGNILTLNGVRFEKGMGVYANSEIVYNVTGMGCKRFKATVGLDDIADNLSCGSVYFRVLKDNVQILQSPKMFKDTENFTIDIDITGASQIKLVAYESSDGNCGDHGNWANARFTKDCLYDNVAPSTPLNFGYQLSPQGLLLQWSASNDNLDTQLEYEVFANNVLIATTTASSHALNSLTEPVYQLKVQAKDDAGNRSVSRTIVVERCPLNQSVTNTFSNQTFGSNASQTIQAQNSINSNSTVIYEAGKSITLSPGFSVSAGSVFTAKIGGCW